MFSGEEGKARQYKKGSPTLSLEEITFVVSSKKTDDLSEGPVVLFGCTGGAEKPSQDIKSHTTTGPLGPSSRLPTL